MNVSSLFILRPIATSLLMIAILLTGAFAYTFLPVSSLPDIDYPTIQVATYYPGASPEVTATSITAPLERQFGQMPGLNQMLSVSSGGLSLITLQFSLHLNLDIAEQEVQAAINSAASFLPGGIPNPPVYSKVNPADPPIMTLALTSDSELLSSVEDYAETKLAQKISEIAGVGLVSISGGQRPAVRIQANPTALASYGLTMEDVRNAVASANVNAAKGSFDGESVAYAINANDQLTTSREYGEIVVTYKNNAPVRIKDVATVINGAEDVLQAAWVNSSPAIIINIQRQPGVNVIKVADNIKQLLPKLSASLPQSVKVTILTDRTLGIRNSIDNVEVDLLLAIILVILVIFVFLHDVPATLIPAIAIPISLVGTCAIMYLLNFSVNNLSLMAMTIATGFVVDDAIVMIENIERYVEQGLSPKEAALKGSSQIGFTIISLTVSLIAALIPLLFMQDVVGRLFKEFAVTLAVAILISAFVSLTLTPMLCAKVLRKKALNNASNLEQELTRLFDKVIEKYSHTLKIALDYKNLTLAIAIATLVLTILLFYIIPKGFFPEQDTGIIQGITQASQKSSFESMQEQQQRVVKIVLEDPSVESVSSYVGIDATNTTINSGRMLINLKPIGDRSKSMAEVIKQIIQRVNDELPVVLFLQPIQDLSVNDRVSRSRYQYNISSHDAGELQKWNQLLIDKLKENNKLLNVVDDQQSNGLQTYIKVNRDLASRFGIPMQVITDTLYDAFGQRQISNILTEHNQYRVVMEILPTLGSGLKSLENIYFRASNGGIVPLYNLSDITVENTQLVITRQNQFPASTISFDLASGLALGDALDIVAAAKKDLAMPATIEGGFQGEAGMFENSLGNEWLLIIAAVTVVYIVLGILYESYIHPVTIISTLPSACMGAMLVLYLSGRSLDIIGLIGIILLIGIVKKNAIMMIDFALEQQRVYGKNAYDAIYNACLLRLRPILMTTAASLLSGIPLILMSGMGSELRQSLGVTIVAGLIVSQVLTLYTTPVVFLFFENLSKKFKNWQIVKISPPLVESPPVVGV